MKKQITIEILDTEQAVIQGNINKIKDVLSKYLISLTPNERQQLSPVGQWNKSSVKKSKDYSNSKMTIVPKNEEKDLPIDFKTVQDLKRIYNEIDQLRTSIKDTISLASSGTFVANISH